MLVDIHPQVRGTEAAGFPYAGTYIGREAIARGVFARIAQDWDGFGFHLEQLVASDDTVAATGSYRGTCRNTGRPLDVRTAHAWKLADGRVLAFEQFTDTLLVDRAMRTESAGQVRYPCGATLGLSDPQQSPPAAIAASN